MKSKRKYFNIIAPRFIIFIILNIGAKSIDAQEVEDETEFDYARDSHMGPARWGELRAEWAACSNGTLQSPIDMSHERVRKVSKAERRHYKIANATVVNRGHDIQIRWTGDAGSIYINGTQYPLRYAHWHSPSEHTVNGRRYDLELHMVHSNTEPNVTNPIAVVGVLYEIGKPDKFLSRLVTNISALIDRHDAESNIGMLHPHDIKMHRRSYHRYIGSLTIPPCTEGVIWTIQRKVITVSKDQVHMLREAVNDYAEENARPLQEHHNREVYLYGPGNT